MSWYCQCGTGMEFVPNPDPPSTVPRPFPGAESAVVMGWRKSGEGQAGPGMQGGVAVGSENSSLEGSRRQDSMS